MGKLYSPLPPPKLDPNFMPNSCWWRHAMIHKNKFGHIYTVTKSDEQGWVEIEWFDGLSTILDLGLDKPNIAASVITVVEPIEYVDVLAEIRPSESFYRITEYSKLKHPGQVVCRDLDWSY